MKKIYNKGHSPRLTNWRYDHPGAYFVTFNVKDGFCCLSEIADDNVVKLSPIGSIVQQVSQEIQEQFPKFVLDESIIMPNHVHAILMKGGNIESGAFIHEGQNQDSANQGIQKWIPMMSDSRNVLGKVVRFWKTKTTYLIRKEIHSTFSWQSRFYDRVIRNEHELLNVRLYIQGNPIQWKKALMNQGPT